MKRLIAISFFLFAFSSANAQSVDIALKPFPLEIPDVNNLKVVPIGALIKSADPSDSTKFIYTQQIYYELSRTDGRAVESKNIVVPERMMVLLVNYQKGELTVNETYEVNAYLAYFNPKIEIREE